LFTDLEELYIEQVPIDNVRQIDSLIAVPEQTIERLQSLSYFYETFYQQLETKQYSTRASRYRKVAETITTSQFAEFTRIIFAGFFAFTASEKQIFDKLKESEKVFYFFQNGKGLDRKLAELGIKDCGLQIADCSSKSEIRNPKSEIRFYKSPDTHGQALALQTLLHSTQEKSASRLDEKTVIILPASETLFPVVHHTLSGYDESEYNIALGYPLARTPLFGFFNNLMEVTNSMDADERVYIPRYLEFMLHPYTKNIYYHGSAQLTRILVHTIEEVLLQKRSRTFWKLEEIERYPALRNTLQQKLRQEAESENTTEDLLTHLKSIHQQTIRKFVEFTRFGEFAKNTIDILNYIYEQSTARLHQLFEPYSESLLSALDTLANSLLTNISFQEKSSYFMLFKKYIETCTVPFTGTPVRGLQVVGLLETRNIRFDTVYLLDFNEGVVPSTKREDTLLPVKVRQELRLPTYLDREQLIAYYLNVLFTGAKEVHLFYIENDEKEKSRFAEQLLWQKQKEDKNPDSSKYIQTIQYAVDLHTTPPNPVAKTLAMLDFLQEYEYNATAVNLYLTCPLQFYYGTVLGLQEKEEFTDRMEKRDIGTLVHTILADYFKPYLNQQLIPKMFGINELESLITNRIQAEYGPALSGASYLLHRQILLHLKEYIDQYQLPLIAQNQITLLDVEQRLTIQNRGFKLKGFLDRIELRNGSPVIIDYKTSANDRYYTINFKKLDFSNRETWQEAIPTLQLPFYQLLYSEANRFPLSKIRSMFLLLGKKGLGPNIELPIFAEDEPDSDRKLRGLTNIISSLLNEIVNPDIPFTPTVNTKDTCPRCIFRILCHQ
jgi:CRISPR/Cas system-associated exonuclease Cas4 (RecB family)